MSFSPSIFEPIGKYGAQRTEYASFDILGRVTGHKQTTDGEDYATEYAYNLSGALVEETYPSGRKVKNTLDNNGDLAQVQSRTAGDTFRNYANSFTYTAAGAVSSLRLGNGRWENTQFNSRLQPTQIGLGSGGASQDLLKLDYTYKTSGNDDNNGNVLSQTITVPSVGQTPGFAAVQTYTYDSLNRINDAVESITPVGGSASQSWKQAFTYDRYGNRNFDEGETTTLPKNCGISPNFTVCAADKKVVNPSVDASNNRLSSNDDYVFDDSGNTIEDAQGRQFTYDAENKQVLVKDQYDDTIGQYFYDGDGKRIKKIVPDTGEVTVFVYDAAGKLIGEYSTEISQTPKISYTTSDHLGSPRIITDENGMIVSRRDFMPFGEEIYTPERTQNLGYGADYIRQKFTGYERDSETDLDFAQARYFNSGFGRFSSPDPLAASATTVSPQSWNRYIYAYNCPLRFNDPSGMIPGDYYNQDGDYLGWDGANDDNIYIVTNKKEKKLIRKNEEKGGSTQLSKVSSAVKLPSLKVRQAVGAAVERTRNPTADDKKGNHHEEAFVAGPSVEDGKEMIVDAPSGPFADLDDPKVAKAESDPFGGDPNELAQLADVTVIVHTHPGGATSSSTTNLSSPGKTVIGSLGGGRFFDPSPDNSPTDLPNAMQYERAFPKATFIVAAVGNNTAYIYNGSGTRATFPLDTFTTLTTRKH